MEVADNSKLEGEFRFLFDTIHLLILSFGILRMAVNSVEGYVIDTSKPWCAPYARLTSDLSIKVKQIYSRSEPNFANQVRKKQKSRMGRARDYLLR